LPLDSLPGVFGDRSRLSQRLAALFVVSWPWTLQEHVNATRNQRYSRNQKSDKSLNLRHGAGMTHYLTALLILSSGNHRRVPHHLYRCANRKMALRALRRKAADALATRPGRVANGASISFQQGCCAGRTCCIPKMALLVGHDGWKRIL